MNITRHTFPLFGLYTAITLLLTITPVYAGKSPTLTTEQIIQQTETQFKGRVSTVSQTERSQIYQVRVLTHAGKVITINVDASTGKMYEINYADTKTNSEAAFNPANQPAP